MEDKSESENEDEKEKEEKKFKADAARKRQQKVYYCVCRCEDQKRRLLEKITCLLPKESYGSVYSHAELGIHYFRTLALECRSYDGCFTCSVIFNGLSMMLKRRGDPEINPPSNEKNFLTLSKRKFRFPQFVY